MTFEYMQVDVFSSSQLAGNGLAVVFCDRFFSDDRMLELAREFKQFETIFLQGFDGSVVQARIFTMDGELPFAGHPVLGAAAALHERFAPEINENSIVFQLTEKAVETRCQRTEKGFRARMRQGPPTFLGKIPEKDLPWLAAAHNLAMEDLDTALPVETVSTGLPYLLIPVRDSLSRARITTRDLARRLETYGASYTYLFDVQSMEARTWDNLGLVEDAATGSAAGPLCAYLIQHGRATQGQVLCVKQGRYASRPSELYTWMENGEVYVAGDVTLFAKGSFTLV